MGLLDFLLGRKKKNVSDPLGLFSNDPIGTTLKNLVAQQAQAAANGKRVKNRMPETVRASFLRIDILKRLKESELSGLGLSDEGCNEIRNMDLSQSIGGIDALFDGIRSKVSEDLLRKFEIEAREEDYRSDSSKYDDVGEVVVGLKQRANKLMSQTETQNGRPDISEQSV